MIDLTTFTQLDHFDTCIILHQYELHEKFRALGQRILGPEEVGRAQFSLATPTYVAVAYSVQKGNCSIIEIKRSIKITLRGVQGCPFNIYVRKNVQHA